MAGVEGHPPQPGQEAWTGCGWKNGSLAVELALLEEHGLTLPPETYPLKGLDRSSQVNWRRKALEDTQQGPEEAGIAAARQSLAHPGPVAAVATREGGPGGSVNFS